MNKRLSKLVRQSLTLTHNRHFDVKVFAIDSKEVANQNDATSINVSSLSNGIYFVNITKDNTSKTVKIIKK